MSLAFAAIVRLGLVGALLAAVIVLVLPAVWTTDPSSDSKLRALAGFVVLCSEVFAFHGGLVLLAIGVIGLLIKPRWLAAGVLALGVVHAGPGVIEAFDKGDPAFARGQVSDPTLTVLSHNLLFSEASLDRLAEIVDQERPDIIALQEVVGERAGEVLERFSNDYPHHVYPGTHRWGGMLLSRLPFVEVPDAFPGRSSWPIDQPVGVVELNGRLMTVVGVHLPAPNSIDQLVAGPWMTADFADWVRERSQTMPVVMAGDFNAPLWTSRMAPLREIGVRRAHDAAGAGRGSTWPNHREWMRHIPGIRLDQAAWVGSPDVGLACVDSRVLGPTGSDHRPIIARFRVAAP